MGHQQVNAYQTPNTQVWPQAATFPQGFNYNGSNLKTAILYQNQTNAPGKILNQRRRGDLKPNTHTYREFRRYLLHKTIVRVNNI